MILHKVPVLEWQGEFLSCQDRIAGVIGGLGSGKTAVCSMWLVDRVMRWPMGKHCFAGRDVPQLRRGTIPSLLAAFASRGIKATHLRNDNTIVIPSTGCRMWPLTSENYESFRSLEADSIYADEISDWGSDSDAFVKYLVPRLRASPEGITARYSDLKRQLRFSTNPPESIAHWLYNLLVEKKFCRYWQVSVKDNHFLIAREPDYIPMLLSSMSPEEAHVLVDGNWGYAVKGRAYKHFDRRIHLVVPEGMPAMELDANVGPLEWALDFNVGFQASTISQTHRVPVEIDKDRLSYARISGATVEEIRKYRKSKFPDLQDTILYTPQELILKDAGAEDVADEFVRRYTEICKKAQALHGVGVRIYGDPAGGARSQQMSSQSANRSNWGIILEKLRLAGIKFEAAIRTKSPSVGDRLGAVNARGRAADGRIGWFISPLCVELVKDLEMVKYVEFTNDLDKKSDPERTHVSDAIGYQIDVERCLVMRSRVSFMTSFK